MAAYVSTTAFKAFRQLCNRLAIQSVLVRVARSPSSDAIYLVFADSEERSSRKKAKSVGRGSAPNRRIIEAIWPR